MFVDVAVLLLKRFGGNESAKDRSRLLEGLSGSKVPRTRRIVGARQVKTCFSSEPRENPCRLPAKR